MTVKPVPEGFRNVTPFILVQDVERLIDFLKSAFNAEAGYCLRQDDGTVMHAVVTIGDSKIMIGDSMDKPPVTCSIYLYLDDVDGAYQKALAGGAQSLMEPADQFYGDRTGGVKDAHGNTWWLGKHIEDVSEDELERRARDVKCEDEAA